MPVDAYRGAGRPESIYCIERIIEKAARELGVERAELRRINFVKPEQMPYTTSAGELYDSGEFARVMEASMKKADWKGLGSRRRGEAAERGAIAASACATTSNRPWAIRPSMRRSASRRMATSRCWSAPSRTARATRPPTPRCCTDRLGVPFERIRIVQGDTAQIKSGGGTGGSRSLTAQGMAIRDASDIVIEKGKAYAAQVFEAAVADIQFSRGHLQGGRHRPRRSTSWSWPSEARTITIPGIEAGLDAAATTKLDAWTFPNGCHIAEVEVDPEHRHHRRWSTTTSSTISA